jgi:hypothetical protein
MGGLRFGMSTRRAALEGLARVMDATALEELFTGSDDDARFMLDLLREAARGRQASCYWEICRTARRRGVTPEYVGDRASVLLASIEERRRSDVYRLLGLRPLADPETIRHRWLEIAKRDHPDVGGDPERFRRTKDAYEILKDGRRRAEYEKYWLRALGPFERVAGARDDEAVEAPAEAPSRRVVIIGRRSPEVPSPDAAAPTGAATPATSDRAAPASLSARLAEVRAVLARIERAQVEQARRDVAARIDALEGLKADLAALARLRRLVLRS